MWCVQGCGFPVCYFTLGKAVGPDGINSRILWECSRELSHPLCFLVNHSLSLGIFPETWKDAMVCAIYKKVDMSSVSDYRPISLLSCLEKVTECNHLHKNSIFTPLQSGFIPGDSTTNQLTYLCNTFSHALDSGKEIRVVFCDISKAFDRVGLSKNIHHEKIKILDRKSLETIYISFY